MFCQNCGTENQNNSLFCESCGTKLIGGNQEALNNEINTQSNEASVQSNEASVQSNEASIQSNEASVQSNEASVQSNEASVQSNEASVQSNEINIQNKEANVQSNDINTQNSEVNTQSYEIGAQESRTNIPNNEAVVQNETKPQSQQGIKTNYYAANNSNSNNSNSINSNSYNAKPKKPLSGKTIAGIIAVIVVIVIIGSVYGIANYFGSPDRVAKDYFNACANKDWEKVYSDLDIQEGDLINKDTFIKFQSEQETEDGLENGVKSYNVSSTDKVDSMTQKVFIEYVSKSGSAKKIYTVKLTKQSEKFLLFFNKWKVVSEDMINPSYQIQIPLGGTAYIDENELTDKYLTDSQEDRQVDTYEIKGMLVGKHNLKITSKIYKDFEESIKVYSDSGSAQVYQSQLDLNKDTQDKTEAAAKEFIKAYFDAGVAGKNFSEIKKYFKSDSGTQVKMEEKYNSFVKSLKPSADKGIDKATLSEISGKAEKGYSKSKDIDIRLELTYKLEYSGTKKNIFTNTIDPITSNGAQATSKTLNLTLENDKWVISDMGTLYVSFY